jgi:hypothetical protein
MRIILALDDPGKYIAVFCIRILQITTLQLNAHA